MMHYTKIILYKNNINLRIISILTYLLIYIYMYMSAVCINKNHWLKNVDTKTLIYFLIDSELKILISLQVLLNVKHLDYLEILFLCIQTKNS